MVLEEVPGPVVGPMAAGTHWAQDSGTVVVATAVVSAIAVEFAAVADAGTDA